MNRRDFLRNVTVAAGASLVLDPARLTASDAAPRQRKAMLSAYYLRAHTYTLVPHQVREDLQWLADVGTNTVCVTVLEQDFEAARHNYDFICAEAEKRGMAVFVVPSRWGGLVAGAPKVPSVFTIRHPETWILNQDGSALDSSVSGRISSVNHPATLEFVCEALETTLKQWPVKGVIWDEPKTLVPDYSPAAVKKFGPKPTSEQMIQGNVDFYSAVNAHIKKLNPAVQTSLFVYANHKPKIVEQLATITDLDFYGCDGRPWFDADGGTQEQKGKVLLGENGERFLAAAKKQKKKSVWLIENHNLKDADIPLLDQRLPEVLAAGVDQLIYYYYPRNLQSPDRIMACFKRHLLAGSGLPPK